MCGPHSPESALDFDRDPDWEEWCETVEAEQTWQEFEATLEAQAEMEECRLNGYGL